MKKHFKVLRIPQEYDLETQAQIVCALAVVHNFMKIHDPDDPLFKDKTIGEGSDGGNTTTPTRVGSRSEQVRVAARRDAIAHSMWENYHSKSNA